MYFNELTMEDLENQYGTKEQVKSIFMSYVDDEASPFNPDDFVENDTRVVEEVEVFDDEASPFDLAEFLEIDTTNKVVEEVEVFDDEASPFDPTDFI